MSYQTKEVNSDTFVSQNVVSVLQEEISRKRDGLRSIESYIAELIKDADRERQKIKELETAKNQLQDFMMSN
jgi:uncharacterized protein YbaP (TraB family)